MCVAIQYSGLTAQTNGTAQKQTLISFSWHSKFANMHNIFGQFANMNNIFGQNDFFFSINLDETFLD